MSSWLVRCAAPVSWSSVRPFAAADASVVDVARHIASVLESRGHPCELLAVRDSSRPLVERLARTKRPVVFNLVESLGSDAAREAEIPALLARLHIPYTGSSADALRTALDKGRVRRVLAAEGIRVARGAVVRDSAAASDAAPFTPDEHARARTLHTRDFQAA